MAELKPCPFCGGKAEHVVTGVEHSSGTVGFGFAIKCTKCHAQNPKASGAVRIRYGADGELHVFDDARGMATVEWNRRSDNGNR